MLNVLSLFDGMSCARIAKDYECPVCLGTGVVEITDRYGYIEKPCNNCYDSL